MSPRFKIPLILLASSGCMHLPQTQAQRIDAMDLRVAQLERQVQSLEQQLGSTEDIQQRREQEARVLLAEAKEERDAGQFEQSRASLNRLLTEYANTSSARSARRLLAEVEVPGKVVPHRASQHIDYWFTSGDLDLRTGTTVVVFWEVWCPHCVREMPNIQGLYERLDSEGVKVVALTRLTKSATEDKVRQYIEETELSLPIGKEDGTLAEWANVSGIPASVVVRNGEAVWRGHPAGLTDNLVRQLMQD